MTFALSIVRVTVVSASDVLTPSGTGTNSRFSAAARSASRSLPPSRAILRLASSVAHMCTGRRGSSGLGGRRKCSAVAFEDDVTTCHGYAADGVVWMMIAPAAPCLAASRYL